MRPCYKSRLFRLGVPGLVFLLWVWWDSGGYYSVLEWERGGREHHLDVGSGSVRWVSQEERASGAAVNDHFTGRRGELPYADARPRYRGRQFDFPKPMRWWWVSYPRTLGIKIGLWAMVAGYVMVWMGAAFAWQRRKARVMRRLTEMELEKEVAG